MRKFTQTAYHSADEMLFGTAKNPVVCKNGLVIGGGIVYPEVNFTLPTMSATQETLSDAVKIYKEMIEGVLTRAKELQVSGLVIELETLPQYTEHPEWGSLLHKTVRDVMFEFEAKYGLKSVMRMTPNDIREMSRPPVMRSGKYWEAMVELFTQSARDGADLLAIESTGGKEINDEAIMNADLRTAIFALGCLGARDMAWLWKNISGIAQAEGSLAAGDTACGFANTSMVLAEQGFIPKIFASVMRAMVTPRTLVAIENGAVGPGKDCAYENVYLKAITGTPVSMEGKTAACAHFSPLGNIAAAVADLWSNESVQQVRLLSGFAPVVSAEQLIYDCRLMNTALSKNKGRELRDLMVESDCYFDPQAYILRPDVAFTIAEAIVKEESPFLRTLAAARTSLDILNKAVQEKVIHVDDREENWIDILQEQLDDIPEDEEAFIAEMKKELDSTRYIASEYGI